MEKGCIAFMISFKLLLQVCPYLTHINHGCHPAHIYFRTFRHRTVPSVVRLQLMYHSGHLKASLQMYFYSRICMLMNNLNVQPLMKHCFFASRHTFLVFTSDSTHTSCSITWPIAKGTMQILHSNCMVASSELSMRPP
jgi:hypothetical protein